MGGLVDFVVHALVLAVRFRLLHEVLETMPWTQWPLCPVDVYTLIHSCLLHASEYSTRVT